MSEQTTNSQTREPAPTVMTRALNALGISVVVGVLAVGGTLGLRHFAFEPREQKAAFMLVAGSTDEELRAKSYDELIDLKQKVYHFADRPGMDNVAWDEGRRIERAITAKKLHR